MPRLFAARFLSALLALCGLAGSGAAATHNVTSLADSGAGTLRDAITAAAAAGPDQIVFSAGLSGTINLVTDLPPLPDETAIRGETAFNAGPGPDITLDGGGIVYAGLVLSGVKSCAVTGLRLQNFTVGVDVGGSSLYPGFDNRVGGTSLGEGCVMTANTVGVRFQGSGCTANAVVNCNIFSNAEDGVFIASGASQNVVGGATAAEACLIASNGRHGVMITGSQGLDTVGNLIGRCFIGVSRDGVTALPNAFDGVRMSTPLTDAVRANRVENCQIASNGGNGVAVLGAACRANQVRDCVIGLDAGAAAALGNGASGVLIAAEADSNLIQDCIVAANAADGVRISGAGTTHNLIVGSLIGTDGAGGAALPNGGAGQGGVRLDDSCSFNTVGPDNTVAGHDGADQYGVCIAGDLTADNVVTGNTVGMNQGETAALANRVGVLLDGCAANTVGPDNGIAGNDLWGVHIEVATPIAVIGNAIGCNRALTAAFPNESGVYLHSYDCRIGGSIAAGDGNVIAGNRAWGLEAHHTSVSTFSRNLIQGNLVGVRPSGAPLGNGAGGVWLGSNMGDVTDFNLVGSLTTDDEANHIAHNGGAGVLVGESGATYAPIANIIRRNSIHDNAGPGIQLDFGGNDMLMAPRIDAASTTAAEVATNLAGPSLVQVFYGNDDEGRHFVGEATLVGSGVVVFPAPIPAGVKVTATNTAAGASGAVETSPFSLAAGVGGAADAGPGADGRFAFRMAGPQPAPGRTSAAFSAPSPTRIRVAVYDVRGRLLRTLHDGAVPAGEHHFPWDGRDGAGRAAASGRYFLTAEWGEGTRRMPVMLVR